MTVLTSPPVAVVVSSWVAGHLTLVVLKTGGRAGRQNTHSCEMSLKHLGKTPN